MRRNPSQSRASPCGESRSPLRAKETYSDPKSLLRIPPRGGAPAWELGAEFVGGGLLLLQARSTMGVPCRVATGLRATTRNVSS